MGSTVNGTQADKQRWLWMLFWRTEAYISLGSGFGSEGIHYPCFLLRSAINCGLWDKSLSFPKKAELFPTWCVASCAMESTVTTGFPQEKTDVLVAKLQCANNIAPQGPRADCVPVWSLPIHWVFSNPRHHVFPCAKLATNMLRFKYIGSPTKKNVSSKKYNSFGLFSNSWNDAFPDKEWGRQGGMVARTVFCHYSHLHPVVFCPHLMAFYVILESIDWDLLTIIEWTLKWRHYPGFLIAFRQKVTSF